MPRAHRRYPIYRSPTDSSVLTRVRFLSLVGLGRWPHPWECGAPVDVSRLCGRLRMHRCVPGHASGLVCVPGKPSHPWGDCECRGFTDESRRVRSITVTDIPISVPVSTSFWTASGSFASVDSTAGICSALWRTPLGAHSNDPARALPSSSTPPRNPPGRSKRTAPTTPVLIPATVGNTAEGIWVSRSWRRQGFRAFPRRWACTPTPSESVATARSSEHRWSDVLVLI